MEGPPRFMAPTTHITPAERRVLELLVAGMRPRDMAATLTVSESTITTHMRNLYRKTEARSQVELALWALRHLEDEHARLSELLRTSRGLLPEPEADA